MTSAVEQRVFSAGVAAIGVPGKPLTRVSAGDAELGDVTPDTVFDLASLTKIFVATAALRLVARGVIQLEEPFRALLPPECAGYQGDATLAQVLAHEGGFEAWLPLFERIPLEARGTFQARHRIFSEAAAAPPAGDPGRAVCYSDLGFMLLGAGLEAVSGMGLDRLIDREVCRPFELETIRYGPLETGAAGSGCGVAPTEQCPWRGRRLVGEVHDDNAWTLGGVAGHAGLFGTAGDVAGLGLAWLDALDGNGALPTDMARSAVWKRPLGRGLGWDTKSARGSSCGARFSAKAFGHLGFTGCSLWVDPERRLSVALLTNRVYYGRENTAIRSFRPRFHDIVVEAMETA